MTEDDVRPRIERHGRWLYWVTLVIVPAEGWISMEYTPGWFRLGKRWAYRKARREMAKHLRRSS